MKVSIYKERLVELAISTIRKDIEDGDVVSIEALLVEVPTHLLEAFCPEEELEELKARLKQ